MSPYIVLYQHSPPQPGNPTYVFICQAKDAKDAERQFTNTNPNHKAVHTTQAESILKAIIDYWAGAK